MKTQVIKELTNIVGSEFVTHSDAARMVYAVAEAWGVSYWPTVERLGMPDVIVKPQTTKQVADILRLANKYKVPVIPRGGGEGNSAGACPTSEGGIMLDMTDMNSIIGYDEVSRAIRFQAGINWGKLHHELSKIKLTTGFIGPHGLYGATVGGSISLDSTGIGSTKYGQEVENICNLEVVLPNGDIIETGSLVNTNTSWYHRYCNGPDIAGLFMGASGSLGVITEVVMRVYPIPEYSKDLMYFFPDEEASCRATHEIDKLGYITEYQGFGRGFWGGLFALLTGDPGGESSAVLLYTEAHDKATLDTQVEAIHEIATRYGSELEIDPADMSLSAYDMGEMLGGAATKLFDGQINKTCSIVPLLCIPEINREQYKLFEKHEDLFSTSDLFETKSWFITWSSGGRHGMTLHFTGFCADHSDPAKRKKVYEVWHEFLEQKMDMGTAAYWIGKDAYLPHLLKRMKPEYLNLLKTIKQALDPNGIMNPGGLV